MITRIMIYEMISNTLSALTMGYACGAFASVLQIALFYIIVELPMAVKFPIAPFISVGVAGIFTMVMGARHGTSLLYNKQISQILKGQ